MNSVTTTPATQPCVCGWNTPAHNAATYTPAECPAVKAATKRLFDQGLTTTRMTRWSNYYIDPDDVTVIVLKAVQQAHADALNALAAAFEPEQAAA